MNASKPGKPRIDNLDLFRVFGILAVVIIHVTSFPLVRLQKSPDSAIAIFYSLINGFSQFAVPSFIFLSGLVLFYNYGKRESAPSSWIWTFYRKRILFILVPYLVWSLIYYLMKRADAGASLLGGWKMFVRGLGTGGNYEHLYYFLVLTQFYILFPLLLVCLNVKKGRGWILPAVIVLQTVFYFMNNQVWHWVSGDIFATYLLPFCLGALIGLSYEAVLAKLQRWQALVYSVFIVFGLCYVFAGRIYYRWFTFLIPYKVVLNYVIYYVFTAAACLTLLLVSRWLHRVLRGNALSRLLSALGAGSFAIFLAHPLVLHYWRMYTVDKYGQYYHYLTLLGLPVALLLSWVIYKLFRLGRRWGWIFIGK